MILADINFADVLWSMLAFFFFVIFLWMIFGIVGDIFRSDDLSGVSKAVWCIFLVFLPFLTALVYLIARGKGLAERSAAARGGVVPETDDYRPAASASPTEDIAQAKALLDAGTISQGEFEALKSKALGHQYFGA